LTTGGEKQPDLPISDPPAAAVEAEGPPAGDEQELREAAQTELQQLKEAARFATPERAVQVLEAMFFAAEKPLDLRALEDTTQFPREVLQAALTELQAIYAPGSGGVTADEELRRVVPALERLQGEVPVSIDTSKPEVAGKARAALETLSIIAYRQPITRPEMEDLRGVDCGAVTKALLERKLIRILGKKDEPGRPLLFGTTKEFLELFNLRDLTQLPTLREFQELSEESRKIVEDESKPPPTVAGLTELAHDPAIDERMMEATVESEGALAQLESAIEHAEASAKTTAAVLTPPAPDEPAKGE